MDNIRLMIRALQEKKVDKEAELSKIVGDPDCIAKVKGLRREINIIERQIKDLQELEARREREAQALQRQSALLGQDKNMTDPESEFRGYGGLNLYSPQTSDRAGHIKTIFMYPVEIKIPGLK